jgi:hypothetical protein
VGDRPAAYAPAPAAVEESAAAPTAAAAQPTYEEEADGGLDTVAEEQDQVGTEMVAEMSKPRSKNAEYFKPITARKTSASTAHLEQQLADFATFNASGKCAITGRSSEPSLSPRSLGQSGLEERSGSGRRKSAGMGGDPTSPPPRRSFNKGRGSHVTGAGRLSITEEIAEDDPSLANLMPGAAPRKASVAGPLRSLSQGPTELSALAAAFPDPDAAPDSARGQPTATT